MRLYVPNHLCRVPKIIHSAKVKHSAKIEFPAVSPLANNQGIYAKKKRTITSRLNLLCGRFTTGARQFAVCLMHTAKTDMHTAKHTRQLGISKDGLCRVQDIGHTTKLCREQILTHGKKTGNRKGDMAQALPCALPTWHTTKFESLPCAVAIAHGKDPTFTVCLVFVVCFVPWHTAKGDVCRVPDLRRVLILREHGKGHVCRVPVFWHTANL